VVNVNCRKPVPLAFVKNSSELPSVLPPGTKSHHEVKAIFFPVASIEG
jgi:hypothetical protein